MSCYHPVVVAIKRQPMYGSRKMKMEQTVPCGSCLGCRAEQARQWAVRLLHEMQMHESAWFLTLTYSDEEMPEHGSLYPEDLQGFFKAVRRDYPPEAVRYYACGEYGGRTQRPHYHAVLFGVDFLDKYVVRTDRGGDVWGSKTLERYWPHGLAEFGTVTAKSAAYVAGYVRKKIGKRAEPEAYTRVDEDTGELVELQPEFARMSLRPAIGLRWIEKYWQDVYPRDSVVIEGFEGKPPRYYDKWLEREHPKMAMEVRGQRIDAQQTLSDYTLAANEKIHEAQISLFSRRETV